MWWTTATTALNLAVYSTWARGNDASGPETKNEGSPEGHWLTNTFQSWPNKGRKTSAEWKNQLMCAGVPFLLFFSFFYPLSVSLFVRFRKFLVIRFSLISSLLLFLEWRRDKDGVARSVWEKQPNRHSTSPTGNKNHPSTRAQNMFTPNHKHSNSIAIIVKSTVIPEKWHRKCSVSAWKVFSHKLFDSGPITVIVYSILSEIKYSCTTHLP